MDELIKLTSKQFALAQRACELQNQLYRVMQEYDKIALQIVNIRERAEMNEK